MRKRSGFTLAEVLITLGIIGVVAAITLPALNSNTGATRNRALLKKGLSTLNSAVMMNEARNGWNFSQVATSNGETCNKNSTTSDGSTSICALLNDALTGEYFEGTKNKYVTNGGANSRAWPSSPFFQIYTLQDGIEIGLQSSVACTEAQKGSCFGYIDVNGNKAPNAAIECKTTSQSKPIWDSSYATCEVDANSNADIFPVVFYDSTVELATNAAKAYFNAR